MTGIILLAVVIVWLIVVVTMVRWIAHRFNSLPMKVGSVLVLGPLLLVAPVADELIGQRQFEALCKKNSVLKIDAARAKGNLVRVEIEPSNEVLAGTALKTLHSHHSYRSFSSGEEIASYDTYRVGGGWFIRMLGISEGNAPLTIQRPWCGPENEGRLKQIYGFNLVN